MTAKPPKSTGQQAAPDELIDRIYAVAVDPVRLNELKELWEGRIDAATSAADKSSLAILQQPEHRGHVERAEMVLERLIAADFASAVSLNQQLESFRTAAFAVSPGGEIVAANAPAERLFTVKPGMAARKLPLSGEDAAELAAAIKHHFLARDADPALYRFRLAPSERAILMQLRPFMSGQGMVMLVVTTELAWSAELSVLLQATFNLTLAEVDVLQQLVQGHSVKDVAAAAGRSVATVRTHVASLLSKTETRSQAELIRMTLGLLDVTRTPMPAPDPKGSVRVEQLPTVYRSVTLPDGRRLDYLENGAREGRPFLWLPSDYGFNRLQASAEAELTRRGLRMIVPVRAGYGRSSPAPPGDPFAIAASDNLHLVRLLRLPPLPIVSVCDDFRIAIEMSCREPGFVTHIVGCGASFPASRPEHYERMPPWHRFIRGNARFAPLVLPFIVRAGFMLARQVGRQGFIQRTHAGSAADQEAMRDPEIMQAIMLGTETTLSDTFTAHAALTAEAIVFQNDWSARLAANKAPVTLLMGKQDPDVPFETLREYAELYPSMKLYLYPDEGHFAFFRRWRELIRIIDEAVPSARSTRPALEPA